LPKERFADANYVIESLTREEIRAKIPTLELFDEPVVE
jgi:hypothetical protein